MSFNFSMSINDEEMEAAMDWFDFDDMKELRGKIRDCMKDNFRDEVDLE